MNVGAKIRVRQPSRILDYKVHGTTNPVRSQGLWPQICWAVLTYQPQPPPQAQVQVPGAGCRRALGRGVRAPCRFDSGRTTPAVIRGGEVLAGLAAARISQRGAPVAQATTHQSPEERVRFPLVFGGRQAEDVSPAAVFGGRE